MTGASGAPTLEKRKKTIARKGITVQLQNPYHVHIKKNTWALTAVERAGSRLIVDNRYNEYIAIYTLIWRSRLVSL